MYSEGVNKTSPAKSTIISVAFSMPTFSIWNSKFLTKLFFATSSAILRSSTAVKSSLKCILIVLLKSFVINKICLNLEVFISLTKKSTLSNLFKVLLNLTVPLSISLATCSTRLSAKTSPKAS